jgi:hypothetical protein
MLTILLRLLGVVLLATASVQGFLLVIFRIESFAELKYIMLLDCILGSQVALSFLLSRIPRPPEAGARWYFVTAVGVVLIWTIIAGGLVSWHEEQVRIRSGHKTIIWPWNL